MCACVHVHVCVFVLKDFKGTREQLGKKSVSESKNEREREISLCNLKSLHVDSHRLSPLCIDCVLSHIATVCVCVFVIYSC